MLQRCSCFCYNGQSYILRNFLLLDLHKKLVNHLTFSSDDELKVDPTRHLFSSSSPFEEETLWRLCTREKRNLESLDVSLARKNMAHESGKLFSP